MSKANAIHLSIGTFAIAAAVLAYPALADMEVTSSTVPGLSVGTKLPDNAEIDVGAGEVVRVMMSGKTYEIAGPYKGTVDQYKKDCPWYMLGKCDAQPPVGFTEPGGTPADAMSVGGTPEASPPPPEAPEPGGTPANDNAGVTLGTEPEGGKPEVALPPAEPLPGGTPQAPPPAPQP
jgi:hypothetical protein